jgi:uncharacterized protein YfaS (alpha-2-macroglobulin family)
VHLRFRSLGDDGVDDVALVDLLPGGFDLVMPTKRISTPVKTVPAKDSEDDEDDSTDEDRDSDSASERESADDPDDDDSTPTSGRCGFCVGGVRGLTYADPREDRVVFYADLTHDVQELQYRIKATNAGTFVIPPAYGEGMYDRRMAARSLAARMEVVRP